MKKLLLPLIAMVVLLSGCGEKAHVLTRYYNVHSDQWDTAITTFDDGTYQTNYYYSEWENIDITPDVIDGGVVLVYYIDEDNRDNLLPFTINHDAYYDDNGNLRDYQERIEYDIERGKVTFKICPTDFGAADINKDAMRFKVCVIRNY